jgi:hypothetical protein
MGSSGSKNKVIIDEHTKLTE